ncbi:MAG: DNA gyrase subunit A [Erysipelotrichaceae bacterium]|nr:DNA gyrase subunit A [Erysipelotrichaceae bacterium]
MATNKDDELFTKPHEEPTLINISTEVRNSFLAYAMSVIVARALPDVRDGLKPVHRRILFSMNDQGMQHDKPYKKCARIVGDVMGKYHPHGDSAIYDALVRLAQDFSSRYPMVDGHGNFGNIDGDGAAAMRYTEARLTKIASEMVKDINKDTVDFMDNYDGEEQEPTVLPSKIPNILVNGSTGIAVGMATNIPPHNLGEVIDAILAIMENPDITAVDIINNYLYGPDFPTGAIILGKSGIKKAYETGNGTIVLRSKTEIEEMEHGKKRIVVTEIPYQVNKSSLVEKIGNLVRDKIIEGITALRDESSREGIRIVIELRKDIVPEVILNQLFKLTQLQISYGINTLAIVNGEPKILPLVDLIKLYLDFQEEVFVRRTRFDLKILTDRKHILEGLKIAVDNIDAIINVIRNSREADNGQQELQETFGLSEKQSKAILEMRLQRLSGIQRDKIHEELTQITAQITELETILADRNLILEHIKNELLEIKAKYADPRRTEISNESYDIDDEDLIPEEDITITLTSNGYIKRVTTDTYKTQNRGGKGVKGMTTNEADVVDLILTTKTHTDILFFTNVGKVYRLRGHQVPEYSRQAKGIPAINLLNMDKNEKVRAMISLDEYSEDQTLTFVTVEGIVKRVPLEEFVRIRQSGKIAVTLKENDELFAVKKTTGNEEILIACSTGKVVRFNENDVRIMGRTAMGVKGIETVGGVVVGVATSSEGEYLLSVTDKGYGKMSKIVDYRLSLRGGRGVRTIEATEKNGHLIGTKAVKGDEDLMIVTNKGIIIRISLETMKVSSRSTQGVRLIKLNDDQRVSSIEIVEKQPEEEIVETEVKEQE